MASQTTDVVMTDFSVFAPLKSFEERITIVSGNEILKYVSNYCPPDSSLVIMVDNFQYLPVSPESDSEFVNRPRAEFHKAIVDEILAAPPSVEIYICTKLYDIRDPECLIETLLAGLLPFTKSVIVTTNKNSVEKAASDISFSLDHILGSSDTEDVKTNFMRMIYQKNQDMYKKLKVKYQITDKNERDMSWSTLIV